MLIPHLANAELAIDLLDPIAARARLGPRFCWGGFIWQVHDRRAGPLLTGPEWPDPAPNPLNAQGLPESFRHSTTTGEPLLWHDGVGLAPGAGALARESGTVVVTPAIWRIDAQPDRIVFRTHQQVGEWAYELERCIELDGRTLRSHSRLTNRSTSPLKLEWFAHPFFALEANGKLHAILSADTTLSDNPGYDLHHGELTLRRAFVGINDGCLVQLGLPTGQVFTATLTHPRLAWIRFTTDFVPFKTVLWANGNTLSLEPFLALNLLPGKSREWTLTYEFGPVRD